MKATITGGAHGAIITGVTGSRADILAKQINADTTSGKNLVVDMDENGEDPSNPNDLVSVGLITTKGDYALGSTYQYVVVAADTSPLTSSSGARGVTLTSNRSADSYVTILSSAATTFSYNAEDESGELIDSSKFFRFDGTGKEGNWNIYSYDDYNYISTTDGNNIIYAYANMNSIILGAGQNTVYTSRYSYIRGGDNQTVNLNSYTPDITPDMGVYASKNMVILGKNSLVNDFNTTSNNGPINITTGSGSTISGGYQSTVHLQDTVNGSANNTDYNASGSIQGGSNMAILGGDITAIYLNNSTISANASLTFLNGTGQTLVNGSGGITAFGNKGLSLTLNSAAARSGLFVASQGNETLDASASKTPMQIYANTVGGGSSSLVVMDGIGDDTLCSGTGNSTFSGALGNNLFVFAKESNTNGSTVINSFATSNENKVALYNYGFTKDSLADWLKTAQQPINTDNTTLTLDNTHTIIFSHIAPSQLTVDDFVIYNSPVTKSA